MLLTLHSIYGHMEWVALGKMILVKRVVQMFPFSCVSRQTISVVGEVHFFCPLAF